MSPKWIHSNAVFTGPHALYPQFIEMPGTTGALNQRAMQVQLVAPNILKSTDHITVTLTVAVDANYANSNDHDPFIGISDGRYFIGFNAGDRYSYPCVTAEGNSVSTILRNTNIIKGPSATSQCYSHEIKIQLKPAEKWGSCYTEHDGGYTHANSYQLLLNPSRGLHLEIYRNDANEKLRFKYIVVDIDLD